MKRPSSGIGLLNVMEMRVFELLGNLHLMLFQYLFTAATTYIFSFNASSKTDLNTWNECKLLGNVEWIGKEYIGDARKEYRTNSNTGAYTPYNIIVLHRYIWVNKRTTSYTNKTTVKSSVHGEGGGTISFRSEKLYVPACYRVVNLNVSWLKSRWYLCLQVCDVMTRVVTRTRCHT